jgi:hypothetical protein
VHDDIPLIFLGSLDPIALRVVDSLARRTEAITRHSRHWNRFERQATANPQNRLFPRYLVWRCLLIQKPKSTTDNDIREDGEAAKLLSVSTRPFEIGEYDEVAAAFFRITEWH